MEQFYRVLHHCTIIIATYDFHFCNDCRYFLAEKETESSNPASQSQVRDFLDALGPGCMHAQNEKHLPGYMR
jgi:hypothetical protein